MKPAKKIFFLTAVGYLTVFVLAAIIGNPFIPDICTSMGYGYPYPVYISWCGCFIEGYPPSVNVFYIMYDLIFWSVVWLITGFVITRLTTRSPQTA